CSPGSHWDDRTRPLCGSMGRQRIRVLHGLCNPLAPLYRSVVSSRSPVDGLVLVAMPGRSTHERDSGLYSPHDGCGISFGNRLRLPPHTLHNLCRQDGTGVPLGWTSGSRHRSLSYYSPVVIRDDLSGVLWIERGTARRSILGSRGNLGGSGFDRHCDRDSTPQPICSRTGTG